MFLAILKIVLAAAIISLVSWLAKKDTVLAGFITALPLTTLLALLFTQVQWQDSATSVKFAKDVFYAIPVSLTFFVPFLFADKFKLSFWSCYIMGISFLAIGYVAHTKLLKV